MKMELKRNSSDISIICICLILITSLLLFNRMFLQSAGNQVVNVYYEGKIIITESVISDKKIELLKSDYPSLLADMTIEINSQTGIRVEKEESPYNICSKQGWIDNPNLPIICSPNKVMVIIEEAR